MFGNRQHTVITGYRDGVLYAAGYLDGVNKVAYLENVEIEMIEGTYITDTNARYAIKVNGKLLTEVGYNGEGGPANRVLVDALKGEYTSAEGDTLSLDGTSVAVLKGDTYNYSKNEEGQVVLTQGLTTIIVEVDTTNRTFVVVSESIYEARDELDLKTFTGTCYDYGDDSYDVKLAFVGNGNVVFTISAGTITYIGSSVTAEQTSKTSYEFDKEAMTLTINVFLFGSKTETVAITFTVAEDFNSLTFTSGVPGYSSYLVNGTTIRA